MIQAAIAEEAREIQMEVAPQASFEEGTPSGKLGSQKDLALRLIHIFATVKGIRLHAN